MKTIFTVNRKAAEDSKIKIPPHSGDIAGKSINSKIEEDTIEEGKKAAETSESEVATDATLESDVEMSDAELAELEKGIESRYKADFESASALFKDFHEAELLKKAREVEEMVTAKFNKSIEMLNKGFAAKLSKSKKIAAKAAESKLMKQFDATLSDIDKSIGTMGLDKARENFDTTPVGGADATTTPETSGDSDFEARVAAEVEKRVSEINEEVDNFLSAIDAKLGTSEASDTSIDDTTANEIDSAAITDATAKATESVINTLGNIYGPVAARRVKMALARKEKYPHIDSAKFQYVKVAESQWLKFGKDGMTTKATEEENLELDAMNEENVEASSVDDVSMLVEETIEKGENATGEDFINCLVAMKEQFDSMSDLQNDMADTESMGGDMELDEESIMVDDEMMEGEGDMPMDDEFGGVEFDEVDEEMLGNLDGLDEGDVSKAMESINAGHIRDMGKLKVFINTLRFYNGYDMNKAAESVKAKKEMLKANARQKAVEAYNASRGITKGSQPIQKAAESFNPFAVPVSEYLGQSFKLSK